MREIILLIFLKKELFHIKVMYLKQKKKNQKKTSQEKKDGYKKFIRYIEDESKVLTMNYSKNIFMLQYLMLWQKNYIRQKIKRKIIYLKDETKKDEKETEKPDKTLETVEEILIFNRENGEQQGLGLKILTPNQMLSRLPIALAQLKAGNNSEKRKIEIRQLLYSFY